MAEKSPIIENEILFPNTGSLLHREGFYWKKRYKGILDFVSVLIYKTQSMKI